MRALFLSLVLILPAQQAAAACDADQLLRTVEAQLPPLRAPVDPRDLSCLGLAQLYFLLTSDRDLISPFEIRQRALTVFRNEGLLP